MKNSFEACLAVTLKWEGGYSNHPDDPGGPTMRGVIQREYDKWRTANGKNRRPVRLISEAEVQAIYRQNYWDAAGCEELECGLDLCVFDAAVNSGVARALKWLSEARDIDGYQDKRLNFLSGLRLWRVFGKGWSARVTDVRAKAKAMAEGKAAPEAENDNTLHAGMRGEKVRALQAGLRRLGYPCGEVDGMFGEQTRRAVVLFQHDHGFDAEAPGVWRPGYDEVLKTAEPMLPKRAKVTAKDLERAGDPHIKRLNLLQRVLAWIFGAGAVGQLLDSESLAQSLSAMRGMIEPVQAVIQWGLGHRWLMLALVCAGVIALVRNLRAEHVKAYRNFDYQGQQGAIEV